MHEKASKIHFQSSGSRAGRFEQKIDYEGICCLRPDFRRFHGDSLGGQIDKELLLHHVNMARNSLKDARKGIKNPFPKQR
jgi:hypothetical protein